MAILLAAGVAGALPLRAQSPAFEVATIKPNHGNGNRSPSRYPSLQNGTLTAENVSLKTLLGVAYGLSTVRITGPAWIDSDRFDLAGKAPEGVPDTEVMPLLQNLIKDRFHAEVHLETKEMLAYEMTVTKDGLKIQPFEAEHPPVTPQNRGGSLLIGVATMPQIADALARAAERPVVEKTGIAGRYSYILSFTPFSARAPDSRADLAPPDLFTAVQQQLGLKLESKKEPIEILVVDRAERVPIEN